MPLHFFNLRSDIDVDDPDGVDLPDDAAARDFALENARDLVCADIKTGVLNLDHCIEVVGHDRALVMTISFRDAFEVRSRGG